MSGGAILDNDAIIKISAYSLVEAALDHLNSMFGSILVLAVVKFVIPKQVERSARISDRKAAGAQVLQLLSDADLIEPTPEEIELAATFENAAQLRGYPLDLGESQCLSVLLTRAIHVLITGDKRAIQAVARLISAAELPEDLEGRIACLEQLLVCLLAKLGHVQVRGQVCAEADVDTAMRMAFACNSPTAEPEEIEAGLASYVGWLRKNSGKVLCEDKVLSVVA